MSSLNGVNGLEYDIDAKIKELSIRNKNSAIGLNYTKGDEKKSNGKDHAVNKDAQSVVPVPRMHFTEKAKISGLADCYRTILHGLGENPERQGLLKTPERAAKAMLHFTKGYEESIEGN